MCRNYYSPHKQTSETTNRATPLNTARSYRTPFLGSPDIGGCLSPDYNAMTSQTGCLIVTEQCTKRHYDDTELFPTPDREGGGGTHPNFGHMCPVVGQRQGA